MYERITNYRIECGGAPLTEYYDEGEEDQNEGEEGGPALVVQSQNNHRMIPQLNTQASTRHPMTQSTYRLHPTSVQNQSNHPGEVASILRTTAGGADLHPFMEVDCGSGNVQYTDGDQVEGNHGFHLDEDHPGEIEDDVIDEVYEDESDEDAAAKEETGRKKKKDKKLVFLSRSVLEKIKERPKTTGTQIANEILELYKRFSAVSNLPIPILINLTESGLQECSTTCLRCLKCLECDGYNQKGQESNLL